MIFINRIKTLVHKRFWLVLVFVVIISYGQMLWMQPWQDDNALFFKLAHIEEPAGYLGKGIVGNGLTKWAVAPFYPIYLLFGHNEFFYFTFLLILYLVSTLVIYKTFSGVLGETGGKVAGFMFAAGYVASDGIWRMANSATTSISLITTSVFLLCYWKFYKSRNFNWYILAIVSFFLALEFAVVRTHYLFAVVVLFEVFFLALKSLPVSAFSSIFRIFPFFYIFQNWSLTASSSRAGEAQDFALGFLKGDFHVYYGFLASLANLVIPDWFSRYLIRLQIFIDGFVGVHVPFLRLMLLALPVAVATVIFWKHSKKKLIILGFSLISVAWSAFSKELLTPPFISVTLDEYFIAALGGVVLIISFALFIFLARRWLFLFLFLWVLVNIAVYSAYNPTYSYATFERYLIHSFLPLVGIFGIIFVSLPRKGLFGKIGKSFIILLGVGNLITAVFYQNTILRTRSFPAREFYSDLKVLLPEIKKDDILYFDVASEAQRYYNDAISTAQMPETAAFAWRYGQIDRYDFKLTTNFDELLNLVQEEGFSAESVNAFWYSGDNLVSTTDQVRAFLEGEDLGEITPDAVLPQKSEAVLSNNSQESSWIQPDLEVSFNSSLTSTLPLELTLQFSANPVKNISVYPLSAQTTYDLKTNKYFWENAQSRRLSFFYKQEKRDILENSQFTVSSEWQNNKVENLSDGDIQSVWQSERTGWGREFTFIQMQLPRLYEISKAVWINGYSSNTPTEYRIETSLDAQNWKLAREVEGQQRIGNREPQAVSFDPVKARYIRMVLRKTANGDSPVVAEFWPVGSQFSSLDINLAEKFLANPFLYIPDSSTLKESIILSDFRGKVQLAWQGDKQTRWQISKQTEFDILYDGKQRKYKLLIPPGGTQINKLRITSVNLPGQIILHSVSARYPQKYDPGF